MKKSLAQQLAIGAATLFALCLSAHADKTPKPKHPAEAANRYTISMAGDGGGDVSYTVQGSTLSAATLLGYLFATYDRDLFLNHINLFKEDSEEKLKGAVDERLFQSALPFVKKSAAYAKEVAPCSRQAFEIYTRNHNPDDPALAAKNEECARIKKKYFGDLKGLRDENDLESVGVKKEKVQAGENDD